MIDAPLITAWLANYRSGIDATANELNSLDAALGDGDFGASMQRGLDAVITATAGAEPSVSGLLRTTGSTIVSAIGGTSGPLVGSLFLNAGMALGNAAECSESEFAHALRAGANAVMNLGGAEVGDKTMIDALVPAADSLVDATGSGEPFALAARNAANEAADAARATADLVARRGRASYTGSGGLGHVDPGAQGVAVLFAALADAARDAQIAVPAETTAPPQPAV